MGTHDGVDAQVVVVDCAVGSHAIERWNDPADDAVLWDACVTTDNPLVGASSPSPDGSPVDDGVPPLVAAPPVVAAWPGSVASCACPLSRRACPQGRSCRTHAVD
jgi:hypothetical protein